MCCRCAFFVWSILVLSAHASTGLVVIAIEPAGGGGIELTWSNAALHGYVVERSSTLPWELDGFEQVVPDPAADPARTSFTDTVTNALCRFYRITEGPPRDGIVRWDSRLGTTNDDFLFISSSFSNDWFVLHGLRGNDTLHASGSLGNDWVRQSGGGGNDVLTSQCGSGEDRMFQSGDGGDDEIYAYDGDGNDRVVQVGGDGNDVIKASSGGGSDDIAVYAGIGDDIIKVSPHEGPDHVFIDAGPGDDWITNGVSWNTIEGTTYRINGGPGTDHLRLLYSETFFTVKDEGGATLYQTGTDALCTVSGIEDIGYSMGLYPATRRVVMEENGSKTIEVLATASRAGEALALTWAAGVNWAVISGAGVMSAPDQFLRGQLAFHPPSGFTGREYVQIRLTGEWNRPLTNTIWVEVGDWE